MLRSCGCWLYLHLRLWIAHALPPKLGWLTTGPTSTQRVKFWLTPGHVVYNGCDGGHPRPGTFLGSRSSSKLFGFSFTIARASTVIIATLTIALCQRLFVRFGASEWNATIGSLTLALSPLYLPLASMFMTDIPGFFAIVVCLYGCVNAVEAETDRATLGWLIFAALSNSVLGTVRQTGWLGALVIVPSACWLMRRRRGVAA